MQNNPPQVIVSYSPAILVPIDGAPVLKPVPGHDRAKRVVNTRALILQGGLSDAFYMHVYDGWLTSNGIGGPWTQAYPGILMSKEMNAIATELSQKGVVDLLDGGPKANPKPSLANGVPTIYTSQAPTELIVFKGQPDFVPIVGTQLLWASNTTSDILINTANSNYYALLSGRWFMAPGLSGPWTFVASNALPPDFAKIPPQSLAGAVLPTVAGTPQAQEAVIENSIPQTATVPLKNGPKFTPNFDGPPQYAPIPGTSLSYVTNSSEPMIQVTPNSYYAVVAGVWFTAAQMTGPWTIATSVPVAIYAIPPSSPIYYVTYVRIYEATPQYVYVGYTPGYLGTVVSPYGTVVYGTGYVYSPWIGTAWYPPPYTYGVAAAPVYNPYVGFTYGFALGLATAAWTEPYWGSYYYPAYWGGYPATAVRRRPRTSTGTGARRRIPARARWYAGGGVAGTTASGNYYNARTGTSGSYAGGRQYNAWTGNATRGYDRTINGAAGGTGNVARASNYNIYTGQRSTANAVSGTTAGGSSYNRAGATTAGPEGNAHVGGGSTYNAKTGQHEHVGDGERRQQPLRRRQRQRLQEHRRRLAAALVERLEQHADEHLVGRPRIAGAQQRRRPLGRLQRSEPDGAIGRLGWWWRRRLRRFDGGDRFGGGGFGGGDRFGGGGGWGGRFGGGGFGGGGFRGGGRR